MPTCRVSFVPTFPPWGLFPFSAHTALVCNKLTTPPGTLHLPSSASRLAFLSSRYCHAHCIPVLWRSYELSQSCTNLPCAVRWQLTQPVAMQLVKRDIQFDPDANNGIPGGHKIDCMDPDT
eukprot:889908-Rhodomonas_salina.1